jgi:ketosteroid isomerase-like protein
MTSLNTHSSLDGAALRRAFDDHDAAAMAALYTDDATIEIADARSTPSSPERIEGAEAIRAHFEDLLGRELTHEIDTVAVTGDSAGFSVRCRYPDGVRVVCVATARLTGGRIARQLQVQAWDA